MLSLMITPIQRLPRYLMLLTEITKYCEKSGELNAKQLAELRTVTAQVSVVAARVNSSFRNLEARCGVSSCVLSLASVASMITSLVPVASHRVHSLPPRARVVAIDARLRDLDRHNKQDLFVQAKGRLSIVHQSRFHVKSGATCIKKNRAGALTKGYKERYIILFSDILLSCMGDSAKEKSTLSVRSVVDLTQSKCAVLDKVKKKKKVQCFYLGLLQPNADSTIEEFVFRFPTQVERDDWLELINAHQTSSRMPKLRAAQRLALMSL
jgi:hypothetical protein